VYLTHLLACVVSLTAPGLAAAQASKEWDGLEQRKSAAVNSLYVRPDASLEGYKHVRLEPLQVSFDKNWKPNASRTGARRLTAADFDNIKKALADAFATTTSGELAKGGYDVVTEAGEDVLDVSPSVIDLYIAAPDKMTAGRSRTYTADAGHMTLVAELRDSETGQILARVIDKRRAPSSGTFQLTTGATNLGAAQQIIARWASSLRNALNAANERSNSKN
jgi:hypothetical protein